MATVERSREETVRLVEANLGLAHAAAARFSGRGESNDDLVQVAMIGLFRAAERFDESKGVAFSTYATATILGTLKHHFRDTRWGVHVPRSVQERYLRVRDVIEELSHTLHRSPRLGEIAIAARLSEEQVVDALEAGRAFRMESLDTPAEDESSPRQITTDPSDANSAVDQENLVSSLLRHLPEREQRIVRMRFQFDMTQREIGQQLGMSQMHVSRLLARSLARLREIADADATAS